MDAWWVGTVSTLAGAVTAALLQALHDRTSHRRRMHTRWDQPLLDGLVDYLATADRAVRALLRWRHVRDERQSGLEQAAAEALTAFEALHEKSQVITLLTGDRGDAVRVAARGMREHLLPMRDEILGSSQLSPSDASVLVSQHRDARNRLIDAAQSRLGVPIRRLG